MNDTISETKLNWLKLNASRSFCGRLEFDINPYLHFLKTKTFISSPVLIGKRHKGFKDRNWEIFCRYLFCEKSTFKTCGVEFGLTPERIRQILNKNITMVKYHYYHAITFSESQMAQRFKAWRAAEVKS